MEICSCINCHKKPVLIETHGMFYVQCYCGKWNPHEFCGVKKSTAIAAWNEYNTDTVQEQAPQPLSFYNNKYDYYINGTKIDLQDIARAANTSEHYIRARFIQKKLINGKIIIKGIKIERKVKRNKNV